MPKSRKENDSDLSSWILPIIMLMVFPPVGVLLLVLKLLDSGKRGAVRDRHPYYLQREGGTAGARAPAGARTTAASAPAGDKAKGGKEQKGRVDLLSGMQAKGKVLITIGAIIAGVFTIASLSSLGDLLYWLFDGDLRSFLGSLLEELLPLLCFAGGGLGCLWAGLRRRKKVRRYRNYLAMIGRQKVVSVSSLAAASGRPVHKTREDLAEMLDAGLFPQGFLDYGGDRLVLSGDGLKEEAPAREEPAAQPKAAPQAQPEHDILSEIKEVNDDIDNEKLSAQIDRVGVITAKILDCQRSDPEKAPQLHSFLSYYLPTTLKILRAYARLEDQEVAGENITAAMQRIEGMMDKVVEGFERQLDQLFQGDVMDITTDVEVLERMLAKDGLSDSQGLTLGL